MAVAERVGELIIVQTEYRERELIKQIPGARWRKDTKDWSVPLSYAAAIQLRGTFQQDLGVGPELNAWVKNELETRVKPVLELREADDSVLLADVFTKLFPYQRAGVEFMTTAGSALIADEMGTGKTVTGIAACVLLNKWPALVVCPNSMKREWAKEFRIWDPGREVQVIDGGAQTRRKQLDRVLNGDAQVAIMNWEQVRAHSRLAPYGSVKLKDEEKVPKELQDIAFKIIIADEAHRAKEPTAKQTRALWAVGQQKSVEHRYALTGTPVANSPEDLWAIMHFIAPEEWPSKVAFIDRYGLQSWSAFGFMEVTGIKGETREEFFKILDPRFIRRLKKVVLGDPSRPGYIPDKLPTITRYVKMGGAQKKAYDALKKDCIAEIDGGILTATSPLTRITRLTQFASAFGELGPQLWEVVYTTTQDGTIINVPLAGNFETHEEALAYAAANPEVEGQKTFPQPMKRKLTLKAPSCKVDELLVIAEELGTQQAVVFAESRQLIEIAAAALEEKGYGVVQITGAVSPELRTKNVEDFQASKVQFCLVTLGAGGEGLTLTAASTGIFLQRSYSLVKNKQAEDRLHRPGQTMPVQIIDIVTEGTVEEDLHEIVHEKGQRLEEVVRDQAQLRKLLG